MHALRFQRHGNPLVAKKAANGTNANRVCDVPECTTPARARGYCFKHYSRLTRHGDIDVRKKLGNGEATPERKKENTARAMKRYFATPHGKLRRRYVQAKRRVLAGGNSAHISKAEFLKLWNSPVCGICVAPVSDTDKTIDHKTPLARGGTNDIGNMQIAHLICNQRKGARMEAFA